MMLMLDTPSSLCGSMELVMQDPLFCCARFAYSARQGMVKQMRNQTMACSMSLYLTVAIAASKQNGRGTGKDLVRCDETITMLQYCQLALHHDPRRPGQTCRWEPGMALSSRRPPWKHTGPAQSSADSRQQALHGPRRRRSCGAWRCTLTWAPRSGAPRRPGQPCRWPTGTASSSRALPRRPALGPPCSPRSQGGCPRGMRPLRRSRGAVLRSNVPRRAARWLRHVWVPPLSGAPQPQACRGYVTPRSFAVLLLHFVDLRLFFT